MAPRKEKSEKAPADQGATLILEYLRKQNRPYSATDISANLHNKVTKGNTTKLLKQLYERKELDERASGTSISSMILGTPISAIYQRIGLTTYEGKQLVYHIPQAQADEVIPEDLAAMDSQIETQRSEITSSKTQEKQLKLMLTTLTSTLSTAELRDRVSKLEKEKKELLSMLEVLRKGDVKPVEAKEKAVVEKEWKLWKRNAEVRKGFVKEMWAMVSEQLPEGVKTRADLWENLGLEGTL